MTITDVYNSQKVAQALDNSRENGYILIIPKNQLTKSTTFLLLIF